MARGDSDEFTLEDALAAEHGAMAAAASPPQREGASTPLAADGGDRLGTRDDAAAEPAGDGAAKPTATPCAPPALGGRALALVCVLREGTHVALLGMRAGDEVTRADLSAC